MANIVSIDGLPVYEARISDEGTGMYCISLVDAPAVMSDFVACKEQQPRLLKYAVQDEEKRLVLGVVVRADFPIYRKGKKDDGTEVEYYIIFKADTIREMAEKYLAENHQNTVNLMHEEGSEVEGVQMVQYFIKGNGLAPEGFDSIADGSLFAQFHVTNDEIWDAIKEGTYKGFSLEGYFDFVPETDKPYVEEVVDVLKGIFSRILKNSKHNKQMKMKGLLARLARALVEAGNITTDKGVISWDGDDEIKVGDAVYVEDEDGNRTVAPDNDYTAEDGTVITVAGGKCTEVKDSAVTPEPAPDASGEAEANTVNTDRGALSYEGELAVGTAVTVADEDGNQSPAPDGEYIAEDGRTIVVADGVVTEIREASSNPEPTVEQNKLSRIAEAFSATYDEKWRRIYDEILKLGYLYPYIVQAGDEFAIISVYTENGDEKFYRFNISEWDEDGKPVLGHAIEVVRSFVTPEEREAAESELATLRTERDTLQARVAELEREPAGRPAHVEAGISTPAKTGNKGIDRLNELMGLE